MSSGVYEEEDVYSPVESEDGDLVVIVEEKVDPLNAFQRGSEDRPLSPETAPIVLSMNEEVIEGYFPESVDPEAAYEAADQYLSEDAIFHFKRDEENWARNVDRILSERREDVTEANGNLSGVRSTQPAYGTVSPSEDDCRRYDASTGWPFS